MNFFPGIPLIFFVACYVDNNKYGVVLTSVLNVDRNKYGVAIVSGTPRDKVAVQMLRNQVQA